MNNRLLTNWQPEDSQFWESKGRKIAKRNLWISIPALLLAFAIWQVWSVTVVKLPHVGFNYSANQLFWLASLPALSGATLRIFYSFVVPIFGGRRWTVISTASLLIPAIGLGFAVKDPSTPYSWMFILALLCGFGGANFSSSMSNISYFFPKSEKGSAMGLNAGLGNLGVSVVQFVVPLVITTGTFAFLTGAPQTITENGVTSNIWLQNAGFIWIPFIIASTITAYFGMNDIGNIKASFKEQSIIFKRLHNWILCWLYIGVFGSFIGFSAAFPLLTTQSFPNVDPMKYAFLGPLVGAITRVIGGWLSDKMSSALITGISFVAMVIGVFLLISALPSTSSIGSFSLFFWSFMLLFFFSGIGNGSTFAQAPRVFALFHRHISNESPEDAEKKATKESATVVGFMGGIGAYGGFLIPKSFGSSIDMTGSVEAALIGFIIFYVSCIILNYYFYMRRSSPTKC